MAISRGGMVSYRTAAGKLLITFHPHARSRNIVNMNWRQIVKPQSSLPVIYISSSKSLTAKVLLNAHHWWQNVKINEVWEITFNQLPQRGMHTRTPTHTHPPHTPIFYTYVKNYSPTLEILIQNIPNIVW